jgi:hypothetical protein
MVLEYCAFIQQSVLWLLNALSLPLMLDHGVVINACTKSRHGIILLEACIPQPHKSGINAETMCVMHGACLLWYAAVITRN